MAGAKSIIYQATVNAFHLKPFCEILIFRQGSKVSSEQYIFFRFELKQTETQSVSVVFWFVSRNPQKFLGVSFRVSDWYRNN